MSIGVPLVGFATLMEVVNGGPSIGCFRNVDGGGQWRPLFSQVDGGGQYSIPLEQTDVLDSLDAL